MRLAAVFDRALRLGVAAGLSLLVSIGPVLAQAALLPNAKQVYLDANGNPLSGGKVYSYVPNTAVFKTTWSDSGQTTANTNPVTLDSAGRGVIFGQGSYSQKVTDSLGNQQWNALTTAYGASSPSGATGTDTAPVGTVMPFAGLVVPTNWQFAYGQAVSRTTFASLMTAITISDTTVSCTSASPTLAGFASTAQFRLGMVIEASCVAPGTMITRILSATSVTVSNNATSTAVVTGVVFPWGNGDGATTFNVPDMRGRVMAGPDAMGGTAATRLQVATTISTTSGSAAATVASASGISAGMTVVSINVLASTTVSSITGTTVTLSANATATAAGTTATFQAFPSSNAPGASGGAATHVQTSAELAAHTHTDSGHVHPSGMATACCLSNAGSSGYTALGVGINTGSGTANIQSTGGSAASLIVQPTIAINHIVKMAANTTGAGGVVSIGGMFGDVLCGSLVTCASQTISFAPFASVAANLIFAGPTSGADAAPTFRTMVSADFTAGVIPNSALTNPATTVNGQTCTLGSTCTVTAAATAVTVGTTTVGGGTTTRVLYDNAGVLGEYTLTGTGTVVAMQTSPAFTTPALGVATGTSLALGGGSIGTDALEITGTTTHNGAVTVVGGSFGLSGAISAPAWTTSGIRYKNVASTLTDTTSSGTVATAYTNVFGANTVAASAATTFTNYFNTYTGDPVAGTNVTMTNKWALGADSLKVGTSNPLTVTTAGVLSATSPVFTTPALGVATGTSLALGGCTIGTNALCATGTANISGATTIGGALTYGGVTLSNAVTGTGNMVLSASPTLTGTLTASIGSFSSTLASTAHTITSASASALTVGLNGATNPALQIDASTASSATGIKVKSAAAAAGVAVSVITSGTNENLTLDAAGSGTITLGGTSTGAITLTRATTLSAALTYGGVALSNAVTGTGNMVLSASPTLTGAPAIAAATGTSLSTTAAHTAYNATAIPAGGTAGSGYLLSSTANFGAFFGSGAPTLSAAQGSLYLRSDGAPYYNNNGTTGWTSLASGSGTVTSVICGTGLTGGTITTTGTCAVDIATQANIWAATASKVLDAATTFNSAGALASLTDAATVTVDLNTGFNFAVTLAGNRTLGNPTNTKVGQTGCIYFTQDGTGTRTLAYASNWKFPGGTAPVLTTTAAAIDQLCYLVRTSTFISASLANDIK